MTREEIADYKQKLKDATSKRKLEVARATYMAEQIEDARTWVKFLEASHSNAAFRAEQASTVEANLRAEIRRKLRKGF